MEILAYDFEFRNNDLDGDGIPDDYDKNLGETVAEVADKINHLRKFAIPKAHMIGEKLKIEGMTICSRSSLALPVIGVLSLKLFNIFKRNELFCLSTDDDSDDDFSFF